MSDASNGAVPLSTAGARVRNHDERFHDIDRAAVLGAALAAILALTLGDGPWNWLGVATGGALLLLVKYFFKLPEGQPRQCWLSSEWGQLLGRAAVVALCFGLFVAWPWQWALEYWPPVRTACATEQDLARLRAIADWRMVGLGDANLNDVANAQAELARKNCVAGFATDWLWIPTLLAFAASFLRTNALSRRSPQAVATKGPDNTPGGSHPHDMQQDYREEQSGEQEVAEHGERPAQVEADDVALPANQAGRGDPAARRDRRGDELVEGGTDRTKRR
jgi:hypothetical protein